MKRTINVNLAGQIFYVEEDAYPVLDTYLQDVRRHFAQFADSEEIQKDIEARIAEQLLAQSTQSPRIITLDHVHSVIAQMGNPTEFTDAEDGLPKRAGTAESTTRKRLFRNGDDAIVGGVASGIAAYFDVDTLWVRIFFVIIILAGGWGLVLYLALWLLVPEAKSATDKVEMRGQPFDLKSLERSIKEKVKEARTNDRAQNLQHTVAQGVGNAGKTLRSVIRFIFRFAGGMIALASSAALVGLIVATASVISGSFSSYVDFPLREVFGQGVLITGILAAFLVAFIPLLFFLLAGMSVALGRNRIAPAVALSLVILWVAGITTAAAVGVYHLPQATHFMETDPRYRITTEQRAVATFTQLEVQNGIDVIVNSGPYAAEVETTEQAQPRVKLEQDGPVLRITQDNSDTMRVCIFCAHDRPQVTISALSLESISVHNGSAAAIKKLTAAKFSATAQNSSRISLVGDFTDLVSTAENGSRITLSGNANTVTFTASNGSRVYAPTLTSQNATATSSTGSRIQLLVRKTLKATTDMSSRIIYTGDPQHVEGTATPEPVQPHASVPEI